MDIQHMMSHSLIISAMKQFNVESTYLAPILNMIIISIVTGITGMIMNNFSNLSFKNYMKKISKFFRNIFCKQENCISIKGAKYVEYKYLQSRHDFSLRFISILYKISKCISEDKNSSVNSLEELQVKETTRYYHNDDEKDGDKFAYIINQRGRFNINDEISAYIVHDVENVSNKEASQISKNLYTIDIYSSKLTIKQLEKFIDECCDEYIAHKKDLHGIKKFHFIYDKIDDENDIFWEKHVFSTNRSFSNLFIDNKEETLGSITSFTGGKDWYKKTGVPWQLGILCYGSPGCGKSSFIKALANDLNRHIKEIPLKKFTKCTDLRNAFHCIEYDNVDLSPENCIIVLEDIDCMCDLVKSRDLNKSENKNSSINTDDDSELYVTLEKILKKDKSSSSVPTAPEFKHTDQLNLSFFLNLIDGIMEMPGRILIMTTNRKDFLDDALIRPGRIDLMLEFKKASVQVTIDILEHFISCYDDKTLNIEFKELLSKYKKSLTDFKFSPAEIVNILFKNGKNFNKIFQELIE